MCEVQGICPKCLLKRCSCKNTNNIKQPKASHDNAFQRLLKKQRR